MRLKLRLLSYLNKCVSSNRTGSKAVCSISQAADPMVSSHISNQFKHEKTKHKNKTTNQF